MANRKQLQLLKKGGVEAWNAWREAYPKERIDLCEADLSGMDLTGFDLNGADLNGADLTEICLRGSNLTEIGFSRAVLVRADLREMRLIQSDLDEANLSQANLKGAFIHNVELLKAVFVEANLQQARIELASTDWTTFTRSDLRGTYLFGLMGTNWSLSEVRLSSTTFAACNLGTVMGLNTAKHDGPSTIGIDTLLQSKGNIPEEFLLGCGLTDTQIHMVKLHRRGLSSNEVADSIYRIYDLIVSGSIQYYRPFISYADRDRRFADKLYDTLQNQGIRCWYAPEHLKTGDRLRKTIGEEISIRQDKMVLVLSKESIASSWVEYEVEQALRREQETGEDILLPIRIDDAVMGAKFDWAAHLRDTRHITDFSDWQDYKSFSDAFQRLLLVLKTEPEA